MIDSHLSLFCWTPSKTKQSAPKRPTTDTDNETEPKKKSIYVRKFFPKWKIGRAWLKYED
jgi:hypothetical protein